MTRSFPLRTIHLDFHTSPHIPDVGADFDPDEFAETFANANVDSVCVKAKCHHGMLYYDTDHPARHPGLPRDLDLLGEQIAALRRRGIQTPVYLSVMVDEYAAREHPEWVCMHPDGRLVKQGGPLAASWHILDMSSPYTDYLAEQLAEVLRKYSPVEGILMDMCWDQPSVSRWAVDAMKRKGLDPLDENDRLAHARQTAHEYMARYSQMVRKAKVRFGAWFNSRSKAGLLQGETRYLGHIQIECLPTGGWGYSYFPYVARLLRRVNLPVLSHTGRFFRSWGDFGSLKPKAALLYECCLMLSRNISAGVGDQMHPRGTLDRPAYQRIGEVYAHLKACEPWVRGSRIVDQIAVIVDPARGDSPGPDTQGLVRLLSSLQHQFALEPADADFSPYELIIVPESIGITPALARRLSAYLKAGGSLLVSGKAALAADGQPALDELGILAFGESPYSTTYFRPRREAAAGLKGMDHVMHERIVRIRPGPGAKALGGVVEPYFERSYDRFCSHNQTPPNRLSRYAAVVRKDRAITVAAPIFTAFGKHGNPEYRRLAGNCIGMLVSRPLVRAEGPAHLETSVVRKGRRTVVHLLSFTASRLADGIEVIEDPHPLVEMPLAVRVDRPPRKAILAPAGHPLPVTFRDGYAHVAVNTAAGHAMVVFE